MTTGNLQSRIDLLRQVAAENPQPYACPVCRAWAVTVQVFHPQPGERWEWFRCRGCGFEMRAQAAGNTPEV